MRKKITIVTVKQVQKLDKLAIEKYGVPSLALMENAGQKVASEVIKRLEKVKKPRVCVICGLGNNAGDGFVIARHLINAGVQTSVFLIGKGSRLKRDAAVNYKILKKVKHPIQEVGTADLRSVRNSRDRSLQDIQKSDIIVDAIFGIGLNREILDPFRSVIEAINKGGKKVISVDTPSGLDGTSGKIYGICVKADVTVTFSFAKAGFFKDQGPQYTGKVVVVDIGIPVQLKRKIVK